MDIVDSFDRNQSSLSMDLLDTDVFFSTEQLGVSELDMAGLTDVDLVSLDSKLTDQQLESNWSHDLDLQPSDLVQFGEEADQPLAESDTSNQGCLDDDFQKMLSDWESHIGSLSSSSSTSTETDSILDPTPELSSPVMINSSSNSPMSLSPQLPVRMSQARHLPVSVRTPVVPKPGVTYTRVAGLGPRVASTTRISHLHSPTSPPPLPVRSTKVTLSSSSSSSSKDWFLSSSNSSCPTATLPDNVKFSNCTVSDLSRTLENQKKRMQWLESNFNRNVINQSRPRHQNSSNQSSVKIIAAVSPGKNGQSTTRILSTRHDSLPRELIEKIKAASQGRKTIAIIEPIHKDKPAPEAQPTLVRPKSWLSSTTQSKWRHVGIVNPIQSQNMPDHDYCSPTKTVTPPTKYSKIIRTTSPSSGIKMQEASNSRGRDSGLESDGSDNSEDGGLYDKLPPYLTNVSVQTGSEDDGGHYSRVPYYMTTVNTASSNSAPVQVQRQSLLKYNTATGVVAATPATIKQEIKQENVFMASEGSLLDTINETNIVQDTRESSSEREFEESEQMTRIQRKRSRSPDNNNDLRSRSKYRRPNSHQRVKNWRNNDIGRDVRGGEERKIVYVGKIEEGTMKADLRNRFQMFGSIVDVSIHFRERGDNYGFITFENKEDAYNAVEHGNDDISQPKYDLCFGGRRAFCKEKYFDLDYAEDKKLMEDIDFDQLLEAARSCS